MCVNIFRILDTVLLIKPAEESILVLLFQTYVAITIQLNIMFFTSFLEIKAW